MSHAITFDSFQYYEEVITMGNERNFDTLQCANRLKAVGVPEKQAEVQAEIMAETIEDKLASKKDIALVRKDLELVKSELKRDIKELDLKIETSKNELKRDIKDLELRMTVKLGSLMVGSIGLLVVLLKLFKL